MFKKELPNEYIKKTNEVINFILSNLAEDLSLEKLAKLANYSPFHFQKIFKLVIGETPKQYIIRMRLQTAAHSLVVHHEKSITEIALNSGFSSSATFARAFKSFYGISSEEYRSLTHLGKHPDKNKAQKLRLQIKKTAKTIILQPQSFDSFEVKVQKIPPSRGIFINTKLDDSEAIEKAFHKIIQQAEAHDLMTEDSKLLGVVYPHHNLYRAVVTLDDKKIIPPNLHKIEISGGKYAIIKTHGDFAKTFEKLVAFSTFWLQKSGYQIANIFYFEILLENPTSKPYQLVEKDIYNPITPKE